MAPVLDRLEATRIAGMSRPLLSLFLKDWTRLALVWTQWLAKIALQAGLPVASLYPGAVLACSNPPDNSDASTGASTCPPSAPPWTNIPPSTAPLPHTMHRRLISAPPPWGVA